MTDLDKKLLIVEDEEELGIMLKRMLKKKFAAINHVLTLQQGLDTASSFHPDVILLDNNLPDGSGIEHIGHFRSACPGACIIVISAMTHLRKTALDNGAFAFIGKPLSSGVVLDTICNICCNTATSNPGK